MEEINSINRKEQKLIFCQFGILIFVNFTLGHSRHIYHQRGEALILKAFTLPPTFYTGVNF